MDFSQLDFEGLENVVIEKGEDLRKNEEISPVIMVLEKYSMISMRLLEEAIIQQLSERSNLESEIARFYQYFSRVLYEQRLKKLESYISRQDNAEKKRRALVIKILCKRRLKAVLERDLRH